MPLQDDLARTVGLEITKTTPAAVAVVATATNATHVLPHDLQSWVYISAIAYAVLQSLYLIWRWVRDARRRPMP